MPPRKRELEAEVGEPVIISASKRIQKPQLLHTTNQPAATPEDPSSLALRRRRIRSRVRDALRAFANRIIRFSRESEEGEQNPRRDTIHSGNTPHIARPRAHGYQYNNDTEMRGTKQPDTSSGTEKASFEGPSIFSRRERPESSAESSLTSNSTRPHDPKQHFFSAPSPSGREQLPVCVSFIHPTSYEDEQDGVINWKWDDYWKGFHPEWAFPIQTTSAVVKNVVRPYVALAGIDEYEYDVEYLSQGSWNAAFRIWSTDPSELTHEAILKVAKPVRPFYKTQSEVATMCFVREKTTIPCPQVFAFDSSTNNGLGLEWILIEMAKGREYGDIEKSLSSEEDQRKIYKNVAEWDHQLQSLGFNSVGSLYRDWNPSSEDYLEYFIGPTVDQGFFMRDRGRGLNIAYGPFYSLAEYHEAVLDARLADVREPETLAARKQAFLNQTNRRLQEIRNEKIQLQDQRSTIAPLLQKRLGGRYAGAKERLHRLLFNLDQSFPEARRAELESVKSGYSAKLPRLVRDVEEHVLKELALDDEEENISTRKRYTLLHWSTNARREAAYYERMAVRIRGLIPLICGEQRLGAESTWLRHWDISERNVIYHEATGKEMLIDWEQISTIPFAIGKGQIPEIVARHKLCQDKSWYKKCKGVYTTRMKKLDPGWGAKIKNGNLLQLSDLIHSIGHGESSSVRTDVRDLCDLYGVEY